MSSPQEVDGAAVADVGNTTDAMLDKISELLTRIRLLEIEIAVLKTEVGR